jgi:predicted AlkP superfamily pyrophosphatase or phosphodiesterase
VDPVRPEYEGAGITNLVRGLQSKAAWVPAPAREADSIVLLILDGLGWNELQRRGKQMPNLTSFDGGAITSVVPSTTPTALTSISTGLSPAAHGVVGYRIWLGRNVLNVIRWAMQGQTPPEPDEIQPREAFGGQVLPVVSRAGFRDSKFSSMLYRGAAFHGYHSTSGLVEHCRLLTEQGNRFVYAYYDGPDLVAHVHGMRDGFFERELGFCDRLVDELLHALPKTTALVVTADHGHVHFDERIELGGHLDDMCVAQSGESRFRYLHARDGAAADLLEAASALFSDRAWCFTRDRLIDEGWLGPRAPSPEVRRRIGDVVLAAHAPIGFVDPNNPGEGLLRSGHGSLTSDEMLVPLVAAAGRG